MTKSNVYTVDLNTGLLEETTKHANRYQTREKRQSRTQVDD